MTKLRLFFLKIKFIFLPKSRIPKVYLITTETVVGLATKVSKLGRDYLCFLKKRDPKKKFAVVFTSLDEAKKDLNWDKNCSLNLKNLKPPITLICNGFGFRILDNSCPKLVRFFEKKVNFYLTSANISGQEPLGLAEAKKLFANKISKVIEICQPSGRPSKVFDIGRGIFLRSD